MLTIIANTQSSAPLFLLSLPQRYFRFDHVEQSAGFVKVFPGRRLSRAGVAFQFIPQFPIFLNGSSLDILDA